MPNLNRRHGGARGDGGPGSLLWLAVLGAACIVAVPLLLVSSYNAVQVVGEGSVGVLRFGGRIIDETKAPGFHFVFPLFYELVEVPVNVKTTEIRDVECGTSGGVLIHLPSVEIVHRLHPQAVVSTLRAYDDYEKTWIVQRVRHDVNQLCARHSLHEIHIDKFDQLDEMIVAALKKTFSEWIPGLQIIAARVAKPKIPYQLEADFVRVEEEVSKLKIAHQHEHLVMRNAEIERSKQVMAAEKNRDIGRMTMAREMEEKEADRHIQHIQDEIHVAHRRDHADATAYSKLREAEANESRLTPVFLELERRKAIYKNLEAFYGDRMPEYIQDRPPGVNRYGGNTMNSRNGKKSGFNKARGAAAFWKRAGGNDAAFD